MNKERLPQSRDLHIAIIDDDPCALHYETALLSFLQNRNGCHFKIWSTTKLEDGIQKCLYDIHPVDVVIFDMSLNNETGRDIPRELKKARPDIIVIGITPHIKDYQLDTGRLSPLRCILDKADLNRNILRILNRLYQEKIIWNHPYTENRRLSNSPPTSHQATIRSTSEQPNTDTFPSFSAQHHNAKISTAKSNISANGPNSSTKKNPLQQAPTASQRICSPQRRGEDHIQNADKEQSRNLSTFGPETLNLAQQMNKMNTTSLATSPAISLTPTETHVLKLSSIGLDPKDIAKRLGVSVNTIYSHRSHIMSKCDTRTWADALSVCLLRTGTSG
ncbi:DNA-binding NarL/FixJ family response regulator [Bifidobacterium commune]|uniref:DNA-binding response regulator, NarL/FixJ family, contains REC and HTH domains n=1 Tax=Bifidobacterium commune TaxID=1505727 RepID=A0A1C4H080_9BIFI|nr:response regulator transcription factor [Bifidobacterium commune]MBB2955289.1 DNA-binding NarL/FixJ family response regulator [Bifidobacterium commune]SCC78000.1 DNA-binding response regulator, NarL/FixJ family, contains REC and HTH domains [Bifidobacterium commune]